MNYPTYQEFTGDANEQITREELEQYDYAPLAVFDGCFGLIESEDKYNANH